MRPNRRRRCESLGGISEKGVITMDYEDARTDRRLYATWLVRTWPPGQLADRVAGLLRDGGYTVSVGFNDALGRIDTADLAHFVASNWAFETDDPLWLDHCRRGYPAAPHPSETSAQRNGGRVSWRW